MKTYLHKNKSTSLALAKWASTNNKMVFISNLMFSVILSRHVEHSIFDLLQCWTPNMVGKLHGKSDIRVWNDDCNYDLEIMLLCRIQIMLLLAAGLLWMWTILKQITHLIDKLIKLPKHANIFWLHKTSIGMYFKVTAFVIVNRLWVVMWIYSWILCVCVCGWQTNCSFQLVF